MKTDRNTTLTLRAHSIRTLTPSELRLANGGVNDATCGLSRSSCGATKAIVTPTR